ncbi:hypothetical protein GCM10007874_56920 [Labrys miyagiensis]|uniref:Uncharacterized protein n=1 Tax=Labrys miyagiensis TaxID=346912 RepID=A0ABQ6CSW9_9HYPH|nr:hypothetical protein [Labrys miyagiensis]GLS22672.1 hypothetical protein GCM10007874_56920 [Labrys miyagiensis]
MADDQQGPNWKLEDDLETVTLTFPTGPVVVLTLNVAQLEDILKNLGDFRARMKPQIPEKYAVGQKMVFAINNPSWFTEPELMQGNSLLHIRDPRFGWLSYHIPSEEALKLSGYLQGQVAVKQAGPQGPRN